MLIDARTDEPVVPNGSLGHRFGETGVGRWNLDLEGVDPMLSLADTAGDAVLGAAAALRRRSTAPRGDLSRGVPVRRVGGHLVTTVFDLMLAQYGVGRPGLPGEWPASYDDADGAVHPGLAGADHRRPGAGRGADRPGVRAATPRSPAAAR